MVVNTASGLLHQTSFLMSVSSLLELADVVKVLLWSSPDPCLSALVGKPASLEPFL